MYVPQWRILKGMESLSDRLLALASGRFIVSHSVYRCSTIVRLLLTQGGEL